MERGILAQYYRELLQSIDIKLFLYRVLFLFSNYSDYDTNQSGVANTCLG